MYNTVHFKLVLLAANSSLVGFDFEEILVELCSRVQVILIIYNDRV